MFVWRNGCDRVGKGPGFTLLKGSDPAQLLVAGAEIKSVRPDRDNAVVMPRLAPVALPGGAILARLYLIGPFALTGADGQVLTPRAQKSRAILAMLALSPRGSRSRVWLRDKLWSDRAEDQASASLRQALLDIRRSLGPLADLILVADNHTVSLNLSRVSIDALEVLADRIPLPLGRETDEEAATEHFLEGLDVRDPEFEDWLMMERQVWQQKLETRLARGLEPKQELTADGRHRNLAIPRTDARVPAQATLVMPAPRLARAGLALLPCMHQAAGAVAPDAVRPLPGTARRLCAMLATAMRECGDLHLTNFAEETAAPVDAAPRFPEAAVLHLVLRPRIILRGDTAEVTLHLMRAGDHGTVRYETQRCNPSALASGDMSPLYRMVSALVEAALDWAARAPQDERQMRAARLYTAASRMFGLARQDLAASEVLLQEELGTRPSAQAYGWLAFLRTFQVGQRHSADDAPVIEEAQFYARRSLELDRDNALTSALVGHIHSYLFGEYDFAAGLFEHALRLNPGQTLGWDLYAMLHSYAGQPRKGLAMSRWAVHLAEGSPNRFYFETTRCIAAALSGDPETAIAAGESALADRPAFNSILRYLVSAYAHAGRMDEAHDRLRRLYAIEPTFTIQSLTASGYPGLDTAGGRLFTEGLLKAGVRMR